VKYIHVYQTNLLGYSLLLLSMEVKHYCYVIGKSRSKKEGKKIQNNKNSLKGECKQLGGKERQC